MRRGAKPAPPAFPAAGLASGARPGKLAAVMPKPLATDLVCPPLCPLCGRPLLPGPTVDEHHLLPRSQGGTATVTLHRICHQAIHATLSEPELARDFHTIEALRQQPDLARFIAWVRKRPADYLDRSRWTKDRRQK